MITKSADVDEMKADRCSSCGALEGRIWASGVMLRRMPASALSSPARQTVYIDGMHVPLDLGAGHYVGSMQDVDARTP